MKIITATMAKNISNKFMNNKCGPTIQAAMNRILAEAEQGHREAQILIPSDWDEKTICNVGLFFSGLDYAVEIFSAAYRIKW